MEEWRKKLFNHEDAMKRLKITQEEVDKFKEIAKSYENIPKELEDHLCIAFIITSPEDLEKAVKRLNYFFKCKRSTPEFFKNRDVHSKEIQNALNILDYAILPITSDDSFLLLHRLSDFETKKYNFDDATRTFIMISETAIFFNGPRKNQIYLFDLKGMALGHAFKPSVTSIMKGMRFLEDACPMQIKEIHIFNSSALLNSIIAMVKPFTKSKILERIRFHSSDINWENFYRDHIPKSHLPSDYGGDLESIQILHANSREKLMELDDYFKYEENFIFPQ